jgi:hypothetical protein
VDTRKIYSNFLSFSIAWFGFAILCLQLGDEKSKKVFKERKMKKKKKKIKGQVN